MTDNPSIVRDECTNCQAGICATKDGAEFDCPICGGTGFLLADDVHVPARGAEAVDNAIGGHGIDSVVVDEAARIYPADLPAATGSGAEIKIDSQLPDVMVGVTVPPASAAPPDDDAFEVWIYQKVGGGYAGGVQARGPSAEDAFLFAFTEMNDAPTRPALPSKDSEEYYQRIYQILSRAFTELLQDGYDAIEINASACGMARRSMEQLVGKDKAIAWDNFVRKQIGWDKAKARIIYPNQVVRGQNGKQS